MQIVDIKTLVAIYQAERKGLAICIIVALALQSCIGVGLAQPARETNKLLSDRIHRIENSLLPGFQFAGAPVRKFSLKDRLEELSIPGLSIAVANHGSIEWARGYGLADVESARKVDADTLFMAASISKPISALRVLQLAEQGVVDLDADVNNYLCDWKIPHCQFTEEEKVTLRRILNHTSGLTVNGFPGYQNGGEIPSVVDVLNGKGNTSPVRVLQEPGSSFRYSGGGYTVMQQLLADIEGAPFPEIMRESVLKPMGMTSSTFENPLPMKHHATAASGYRSNGGKVAGNWPVHPEMAAAGMWTTPSQLIRYALEVQRIVQSRTDGVLSEASVQEMLSSGENRYGLGPEVSEHWFGHSGANAGFRARLIAWKNTGNAVAVMVNSENDRILDEVLRAVAAEYDLPGFASAEKIVFGMPASERARFAGVYELPNGLKAGVAVDGEGIALKFGGGVRRFLPESEDQFINPRDGVTLRFHMEGNRVVGFEILELKIEAKRAGEVEPTHHNQ